MNRTYPFYKKLFILLPFLVSPAGAVWGQANLNISVTDIRSQKGHILYSLYKEERGFPDDPNQAYRRGKIPANAKEVSLIISDILPGYYALSLIHDENGNNRLDKNKMGIPTEGFAFSNNVMGAFGPPKYMRARFLVKKDSDNTQSIRLRRFQ